MSKKFKDIDITYYFFNDMINIKNLVLNKIEADENSCKSILIYYIGWSKT